MKGEYLITRINQRLGHRFHVYALDERADFATLEQAARWVSERQSTAPGGTTLAGNAARGREVKDTGATRC